MSRTRSVRRFRAPSLVLAVCMLLSAGTAAAGGFDFGGSLNLLAGFENDGEETEARLESSLGAWLRTGFGPFTLFLQGSVENTLERSYLIDVDAAKFSGRFPGFPDRDMEFLFDAGRFAFSDFTGFILNDTADGLRLAWNFPFSTLTVEAGWFGFVIKPDTTVLLSQSDAVDSLTEDVYYAPRRLFETLSLQIPEAFLSHDLRLAWLAQQDLRRSGDFAEPGDRVNTFYAGAGLEGSFLPGIFHDFFAFGGFGSLSGDQQILSGFFGAGVRYYRKDSLSSRYDFRFLRATGEPGAGRFYSPPGGGSGQFLPISQKDTGIVFSPRMGNLTLCEIGWSGKPREPLVVDVRGFAFWRSAAGPISEGGIDQEDDRDLFLGLELDARASWRFYSDFGVSAGLGCFLPAAGSLGAFYDDSARFTMTVEATLAF